MPLAVILIFLAVFGATLIAFGVGIRLLESDSRKKRAGVLAGPDDIAAMPESPVLVEYTRAGENRVASILDRWNIPEKMQTMIQQAGMTWTWTGMLGAMAGCALAGALIALKIRVLMHPVLSAVALGALCGSLPYLHVARKRRQRLRAFERQFPEALDFLARALRAGHAFTVSLEMLAQESPEPLQGEFRKVYNEQNLGESLNVVLMHLGERVPLIDVRFFIAAVLMQREAGGNLGEILTKLSQVIRERFRIKGQLRAITAHGRITAMVLTVMPLVVVAALMVLSPKYLAQLAREPEGKIMILCAFLGQMAGYLIMKKIVNIKI